MIELLVGCRQVDVSCGRAWLISGLPVCFGNVIYVPSAFVSDGPEYRHYLPCLADASGNLTVMTTILQLRTRSFIEKYLYITKNPTHESGNKTTCEREPLILVKKDPTSVPKLPPFEKLRQKNPKTNR